MKRDIIKAVALIIGFALLVYGAKSILAQSPAPTATPATINFSNIVTGTATLGFDPNIHVPDYPHSVMFMGGVTGQWLKVERHNKNAHDAKGFDPAYTLVISNFKPIVTRNADGSWSIHFVSEIAEKRP